MRGTRTLYSSESSNTIVISEATCERCKDKTRQPVLEFDCSSGEYGQVIVCARCLHNLIEAARHLAV